METQAAAMAFQASMEIPLLEFFSYKNQILLLLMPVRISGPEFLYKAFDFIKIEYIGAKICKDGPKVNVAVSLLSVYKVQIVFSTLHVLTIFSVQIISSLAF